MCASRGASRALRCESSEFCRDLSTISSSATTHHDLLREEELVDFAALLPRPDDEPVEDFFAAERDRLGDDSLDADFFAAARDRLGDDSLDADFFAAERDRLDDAAVEADFFAGLLAAGADSDRLSEP
jgi:hypothetical protein